MLSIVTLRVTQLARGLRDGSGWCHTAIREPEKIRTRIATYTRRNFYILVWTFRSSPGKGCYNCPEMRLLRPLVLTLTVLSSYVFGQEDETPGIPKEKHNYQVCQYKLVIGALV